MTERRTNIERGYGRAHKAERAKWKPRVEAGGVDCAKCGLPIAHDATWDLGHTEDRKGWTGPEHPGCNRATGGSNGNRVMRERTQTIVRSWF